MSELVRKQLKDPLCFRELDDGRGSDRQPFTGYQNPRPEIIRTISNPYARTLEVSDVLWFTSRERDEVEEFVYLAYLCRESVSNYRYNDSVIFI